MEVGVEILVSICIHYNFSALFFILLFNESYFFTQCTPKFSLSQHKTYHAQRVYDTTKQKHYTVSFPVGAPHKLECPTSWF